VGIISFGGEALGLRLAVLAEREIAEIDLAAFGVSGLRLIAGSRLPVLTPSMLFRTFRKARVLFLWSVLVPLVGLDR
jgi:hypothetical protein